MLLAEFSKTSSYNKILTGIQPIKQRNLYYPIPINIAGNINILSRTKVRKITLIEVAEDTQDIDTILIKATQKAIFLNNLLHTEQGSKWYKLLGFHRKTTNNSNY